MSTLLFLNKLNASVQQFSTKRWWSSVACDRGF